jgi:hypothetical protein
MKIDSSRLPVAQHRSFKPNTPPPAPPASTEVDLYDAWSLVKQTPNEALYAKLFQSVQQLAMGGVPGLAGVALAKVVCHSLDTTEAPVEDKGDLAYRALAALQNDSDLGPQARQVYDKTHQLATQPEKDQAVVHGLRELASLESWNFADSFGGRA